MTKVTGDPKIPPPIRHDRYSRVPVRCPITFTRSTSTVRQVNFSELGTGTVVH